jgi:peptidoglycan hydrolase-like protein with peptidoglycan-binding domain
VNAPPRPEQDGARDGAPASTRPATSTATPASAAAEWPQDVLGADGAGPGDGARRLTRRRLAVAALLAVACAVVAIVLASGGHGRGGISGTGVPAGDTTATVERRTLTESSTVDGTLGSGTAQELYDRLAGTFTWLPSVGATIARGGTLFCLNNLPVVLLYGTVPAYRALKQGVSDGPDVAQLNRNLIDLGYDPYGAISDLEDFAEATAAAVRRWQKAEGLPETGEVELGRVVFAPSARRVTTVHVTLGQDPPGAESPAADTGGEGAPSSSPGSGKATKEPAADKKPTKKRKPKSNKPNEPGKGKPSAGEKPKEEGKPAASEPNEGTAHDASNKSPAKNGEDKPSKDPEGFKDPQGSGKKPEGSEGAGEAVLTTTSTQQLVQVKLKAEQQQLAHVGERAPVTLPGGGVVQGTIVEVGTVASEAKGGENEKGGSPNEGSGESTIPVTLALARRVPRLEQAPVSVELVKNVRRNVLAVPATALTATGGGHYAVELLEGDRRLQLAVTPGMFANGYVQVEGSGLHEGQTVVESE